MNTTINRQDTTATIYIIQGDTTTNRQDTTATIYIIQGNTTTNRQDTTATIFIIQGGYNNKWAGYNIQPLLYEILEKIFKKVIYFGSSRVMWILE